MENSNTQLNMLFVKLKSNAVRVNKAVSTRKVEDDLHL